MKVLYYHQYFKTRNAAGGTRSYEFAKRLIEQNHEVTIVCARDTNEELSWQEFKKKGYRIGTVEGIKVIQINLKTALQKNYIKRAFGFIRFVLKSVQFAFSENYDILFASSTPLTIGIPGLIIKFFKPKTKFVFEVRDLWPELPKAMGVIKNPIILRILSFLEKRIYLSANKCIGLSPGMVEGIVNKGVSRKDVCLIPNASDLELFYPENKDKDIIKGCTGDDFVAIFAGSHGVANGLGFILDVAKYLKKKEFNNIKLVFIGKGTVKDKLIKRASDDNLSNCIFLDPLPKMKLVNIMQASDVGMMILEDIPEFAYGTSPNKFFDYIATGLPVMVNHFGWVADLVAGNKCGFATDAKNHIEYAQKLIYLSQNKDVCIDMGLNARKLAEKEFDREVIFKKFINFLEKVEKE